MQQFTFSFNELDVDRCEAEQLLGFEPGQLPEPFNSMLTGAIEAAPELCQIQAGYRLFHAPVFNKDPYKISVEGVSFLPGKIVYSQLKSSESVALFIATAGPGISGRIKELAEEGDAVSSYVFDVLGSVIAEKAARMLVDRLERSVNTEGLKVSDPFSPGYCDWSVAEQQNLFSFFPEGFCGVTLSGSSLMSPVKSVSGIVGIGTDVKRRGAQCFMCNDVHCLHGKIARGQMAFQ
jgi:hypothetical protein